MTKLEEREKLMHEIREKIDAISKLGFAISLDFDVRLEADGWVPRFDMCTYVHNSLQPGMKEYDKVLTWKPTFPTPKAIHFRS